VASESDPITPRDQKASREAWPGRSRKSVGRSQVGWMNQILSSREQLWAKTRQACFRPFSHRAEDSVFDGGGET